MDRRQFLKKAGMGLILGAVGGCGRGVPVRRKVAAGASGTAKVADRPNILFCISDDQCWPHAGAYGSKMVKTPAFDRVAREGVLFTNAFVSAPSCCPSRGSVLTGQAFYRLEEGSQNHSTFPRHLKVYPDILEEAGYHIGFTGKGWGPGDFRWTGWPHNPAGWPFPRFRTEPPAKGMDNCDYARNFEDFLAKRQKGEPFCFWYGCIEPHRNYEKGSGLRAGKTLEMAEVPPFLPDCEQVRTDLLDYALEVDYFDEHLGRMLKKLGEIGELDNTIIVVTGDNGMPFPRAKTNLYDYGTHAPLAIRWGSKVKGGRVVDDFVSFTDFAPTFLEAAGLSPFTEMTGRSLMNVLLSSESGKIDPGRDHVITGRESHHPAAFHSGGQSFPCRAIRMVEYLYIRNYKPGRNAAGDAPEYNDIDGGLSKTYMIENHESGRDRWLFEMAFGPRPAEELYDLKNDPEQLQNVAGDPKYDQVRQQFAEKLEQELKASKDPRALGNGCIFDQYPTLTGRWAKPPKKR